MIFLMFKKIIEKEIRKVAPEAENYQVSFAPEELGDYSTNLALIWAKQKGENPMDWGKEAVEKFKKAKDLKKYFSEVELVKPGFINFKLGSKALAEGLKEILKKREHFGQSKLGRGEKVNIEFVSANPTGPLTLGNGRSAAYGESLSNLLNFLGYKVTKEYFLNDLGKQVRLLGESVARRFLELEGRAVNFPEEMYQGEYIRDLAKDLKKEGQYHGSLDDFEQLAATAQKYAVAKMTQAIKESLARFGVHHDVWFAESELEKNSGIKEILNYLAFNNLSYEKEGALWFKGTEYGLDQNAVIRKSDGATTYLLSDFAYAKNKEKRKFAKMIYLLGADHHGDVARIKAGLKALGLPTDKFHFLLYQLVTLKEKGETVRMSKRAGRIVTLDDLLKEIPADVAKYFFLAKSLDSHIEFDLDLAKEESNKNPVYYLQYAYVRLSHILNKAQEAKIKADKKIAKDYPWPEEEQALVRHLLRFPEILEKIGQDWQIHQLTGYAYRLAEKANRFYETRPVLQAEKGIAKQRLALVAASVEVLRNALGLLGFSLPEKM